MAAATLKIFITQTLTQQYSDLTTAGVRVRKEDRNYKDKSEVYTFLGAQMTVEKRSGAPVKISIDCAMVPAMA